MAIAPIGAVSGSLPSVTGSAAPVAPSMSLNSGTGFAALLTDGLATADAKVAKADALIKAFALGEPVPVHQVTIALEQARIAVELSVQIRERLTETYRSFMNMQL
jgi:flagellar hook-basal body complex protein FliE